MGPYLLVPIFLLLSYSLPAFALLSVYAGLLCIPVAVYAGDRHGWRGVEAALLGGLLLPFGLRSGLGAFPPELDLYLLSVAVASMAASKRPLRELAPEPMPTLGYFAAFALLPVSVLIAREEIGDGLAITVAVSLLPLLYFLLFLFGLARRRDALVITTLLVATVAGIALGLSHDAYRVRYLLDTPAEFLTGAGWYLAGRYVQGLGEDRSPSTLFRARPRASLAALLVLWGAEPLWTLVERSSGEWAFLARQLAPVGSFYALPLAALFAGLRFRFHGAAIAAIAALAVELAGPAMRIGGANLGVPFVAFGFAALGVHIGDRLRGRKTEWYPWHWTAYILFCVISVPLMLGPESLQSPEDMAAALAFVALLIGMAFTGRKLLNRTGTQLAPESLRGLVATAGAVLLLLGVLGNLQAFWDSIVEAANGIYLGVMAFREEGIWEPDNQALLAAGAVLYLAMLLAATSKTLESVPPLIEDWGKLRAWAKASIRERRLIPAARSPETAENEQDSTPLPPWLTRTTKTVRWLRNGTALIGVLLIGATIAHLD